jgi:hypothetical protein
LCFFVEAHFLINIQGTLFDAAVFALDGLHARKYNTASVEIHFASMEATLFHLGQETEDIQAA